MRKNTPTWGRESPKRITVKRKPRGFRVVARNDGTPVGSVLVIHTFERKGTSVGLVLVFHTFG